MKSSKITAWEQLATVNRYLVCLNSSIPSKCLTFCFCPRREKKLRSNRLGFKTKTLIMPHRYAYTGYFYLLNRHVFISLFFISCLINLQPNTHDVYLDRFAVVCEQFLTEQNNFVEFR